MTPRRGGPRQGRREGEPESPGFRPNLGRQAGWAAAALAAMLGGYFVGGLWRDPGPRERPAGAIPATATPAPWYRSRPPPPTMVTAADAPILPDPDDETPAPSLRAYEEALPREIYETPPGMARPVPVGEAAATPPWRRFALAAPKADGRPRIAVVIDDMGVDRKRSARVVALQGPLTLAFLSYAGELAEQTAAARAAGHELLLHIPMEPASKTVDPGPQVLESGLAPEELRRRLRWALGQFEAYVGVNNHMGSKFTEDAAAMTVVIEEIRRRGLLFLDSRTTTRTVGAAIARAFGVPVVERNVFLDNDNELSAVNARLGELEDLARRQGFAVAIGHPRDATLAALAAWRNEVEARGFVLVPITAVLDSAAIKG